MSGPLRLQVTFAVLAALAAVAAFSLPPAASAAESVAFTVKITGEGEGEVECEFKEPDGEGGFEEYEEPCPETATSYPKNTEVNILPEAEEPEFEFAGFKNGTGNAKNCTTKCKVKLTEATTVEARFDYVTFPLKIKTAGNGMGAVECEVIYVPTSVYPSEEECEAEAGHPSEVRYPYGTELILYAKGKESKFLGWEGCEYEEEEECEVTMEEAKNVVATFESTVEYTLDVEVTGPGTVSGSPGPIQCQPTCSGQFRAGTTVTLTAAPSTGAIFDGWAGGGCKGLRGCTVTISGDTTVAAEFEPAPRDLEEEEEPLGASKAGIASVARLARVKGGKAALKLSCKGGPCKGTLKLTAKVKQGGKAKVLVVGKASFNLADRASKTIAVKLSGPAKRALAGGGALTAKLSGTGIAPGKVKLEPAAPKPKHA